MTQNRRRARHGALAVEAAIVYPVWLTLLLGLIVGGIGVFRYQQAACLAREGARWASVHGSDWQAEHGTAVCTQQNILDQSILPMAVGMDRSAVSVQVQFVNRATNTVSAWDSVTRPPNSVDRSGNTVSNRVRVTVTYQWTPEVFLLGPLNLSSTSETLLWY